MKILLLKITLLGLLLLTSPLRADTELENATLARICHVLRALMPLIDEAEQQQEKNTRLQFQYKWLRSDIHQIQAGIDQKLHQTGFQPRIIKPLKGDYGVLKSQQR